jgi:RsiW-degrading membrane proteinase PrsW (M82 family)
VPEPPVYFAFTGGRQIGPLHFAELADLASRGVLLPDDLAWKSGTPEWVSASQLLAFPKRKTAARVRGALQVEPEEAAREEEILPVASAAAAEVAPAARPGSPAPGLPSRWPRVTLTAATDDPGLAVHETTGGDVPAADRLSLGRPMAEEPATPMPSRLAELLPLGRLNDAAVLGAPVTWALVFFGLGPLFVSAIAEDPLLRIRLFNFGCGALWVAFFYAAFHPENVTSRAVLAVFFSAVLFAALYIGVLLSWPPVATLATWAAPDQGFGARLLASLFGAALVQEVGKAALLVLVARTMGELAEDGEGLFHGLIAGAGFGLCMSLLQTWSVVLGDNAALRGSADAPATVQYAAFLGSAVRAVSEPFLHALWTAVAGAFLAQGLPRPGRRAAPGRILLGIAVAVVLHGLYDALAPAPTTFLSVFAAAAAVALFLSLRREADEQPVLTALR